MYFLKTKCDYEYLTVALSAQEILFHYCSKVRNGRRNIWKPLLDLPHVPMHLVTTLFLSPLQGHLFSWVEGNVPLSHSSSPSIETQPKWNSKARPSLLSSDPCLTSLRHLYSHTWKTALPTALSLCPMSLWVSMLSPSHSWLLEEAWGQTPSVKKTFLSAENAQGLLCLLPPQHCPTTVSL
jgi:hypothetical protein